MSHTNNFVTLHVSDDTQMQAYVATPSGNGPFPGLILFQEAFGVNAHIRDMANRFAEQGYVTIAPELFHRTAEVGYEGSYANFSSVASHYQAVTTATLEADTRAAWDWLTQNTLVKKDALACIGYCMGGRACFFANTIFPFKAAISYYGGGIAQELATSADKLHAPMLFFWGGQDTHITPEHVNTVTTELTKAGKKYTNVVFSYAGHAFFCDARPSYNAEAAADAWPLTLAFLKNKLA